MTIPAFPRFKPIELADRETLEGCFRRHPPLTSEFTFTNLFGWRKVHHYRLSRYREGFLILKESPKGASFLQPVAVADRTEALLACLQYLEGRTDSPAVERVGEDFVSEELRGDRRLAIAEDRDSFDYLYLVRELAALAGEKFHDKKNLLNQFLKKYQYNYQEITPDLIPECRRFQDEWCEERDCDKVEGLRHEREAVMEMLNNFKDLGASGGVIWVDGKIEALTLGEPLNRETFVIHVEKARSEITGLYQAINWEFLKSRARAFRFVNREQDLGVPGLRKAKLSYNPVRLIKKYRITGNTPRLTSPARGEE